MPTDDHMDERSKDDPPATGTAERGEVDPQSGGDSGLDQPAAGAVNQPAAGGKNGPKETPSGRPDGWAIAFGVIFWLAILGVVAYNSLGFGDPELEIVVAASPADIDDDGQPDQWSVGGHLIYDGQFVNGVGVWAIAIDQQGNRFSTDKSLSESDGSFTLEPIPHSIGGRSNQAIVEIAIHARGQMPGAGDDADDIVEFSPTPERIGVGTGQRFRIIGLPVAEMLILAAIFALSVAVALVPLPEGSKTTAWLVVKYVSSVIFAFLLTVFMILYLSLGLRYVNLTASNIDNETMSLGMANIFRGRYVENASMEWLISLTSPSFAEQRSDGVTNSTPAASQQAAGAPDGAVGSAGQTTDDDQPNLADAPMSRTTVGGPMPIEKGFGAPLWVLLVAVLGAALFTISIILVGIGEAPLQLQPHEIRERIKTVVLHQFYMLFAPIGAIFVYQLLVIAGAASQPAAVAIAVLAAGVSLNLLLEKARQTIVNLFSGTGVKLT
jgi:hypothetical protein